MTIDKTPRVLPSNDILTGEKTPVSPIKLTPGERTPGECKEALHKQPKIFSANNPLETKISTDDVTAIYQDRQFLNGEFKNTAFDKNTGISLLKNKDGSYPSSGEYISPVINTTFEFNEAIASWNCKTTPDTGLAFCVRTCKADGTWTPWYLMGTRGNIDAADGIKKDDSGNKVNADTLSLKSNFTKIQYKVDFVSKNKSETPALNMMTLCHTNTVQAGKIKQAEKIKNFEKNLTVPFRSQRNEDPSISGRVCGPTSLAMILEYHGIKAPTADVAKGSYDKFNDIYGNWPYLVACASEYGLKGEVQYFTSLDGLKEEIKKGCPVVVGVLYKNGERSNADFLPSTTDGHMLVVTGFDKGGNVLVADPAAKDAKSDKPGMSGVTVFKKEEFFNAWIGESGYGVALTFRDK